MKLKDLCSYLDSAVPLAFQESYDNSGLQVGFPGREISSVLITLDVTEEVLAEAVRTKSDVIVSHHPLIFNGLKKISGGTSTERIIMEAVKNDISVYSAHTNLDALENGVSKKMGEKLGLTDVRVLKPLKNQLLKLVVYIPADHLSTVSEALFNAGAGVIGNYDNCGFSVNGTGTFKAGDNTNPYLGEKGKIHLEKEIRFETVLFSHLKNRVIKALLESHPYEEVAYDIYSLQNENIQAGLGCLGSLPAAMTEMDFLQMISEVFGAKGVRYSGATGRKISRVAICGGTGGFLLYDAIAAGADAFITADMKYHGFLDAGKGILLADIGHYESEKFAQEILYDLIIKKFPTFAVRFSEINTNPINYL